MMLKLLFKDKERGVSLAFEKWLLTDDDPPKKSGIVALFNTGLNSKNGFEPPSLTL